MLDLDQALSDSVLALNPNENKLLLAPELNFVELKIIGGIEGWLGCVHACRDTNGGSTTL